MKIIRWSFGLVFTALLVSCSSYQQQAGVIGGLVGAATGAAFGDDHQDVIAGAAVGAAVGAGGAAIHEQNQRRNYERYGIPPDGARSGVEPNPSPAPPADPGQPDYPVARATGNPSQVISPFPPHQRIDISGFRSGQLARDPKSGQVFRVP
ncbi:MAG: glycine zipper domain-containing protein [Verrucomicrobiota bacterium]